MKCIYSEKKAKPFNLTWTCLRYFAVTKIVINFILFKLAIYIFINTQFSNICCLYDTCDYFSCKFNANKKFVLWLPVLELLLFAQLL